MIKEKTIEIKISTSNYNKYYEKYGPFNINDIIEIDTTDLTKSSAVIITAICRDCSIENKIKYYNYRVQFNRGDYYCCHNCSKVKNKNTNVEKYGTEYPLQNNEIIEKSKKTMLKVYGVDNISKLDSIKENRRDNFKTNNFKTKSRETWLLKYGFDNPSKSNEIKLKKEETTLINYGVRNPSQSFDIFEKSQISGKKLKLHNCGLMYRGSYEKDFLDFCERENIYVEKGLTIKYNYDGKDRYYHSDFFIPSLNLICEIKSLYYYELYLDKNIAKMKSAIENGYNFEFIVDKNYIKLKNPS